MPNVEPETFGLKALCHKLVLWCSQVFWFSIVAHLLYIRDINGATACWFWWFRFVCLNDGDIQGSSLSLTNSVRCKQRKRFHCLFITNMMDPCDDGMNKILSEKCACASSCWPTSETTEPPQTQWAVTPYEASCCCLLTLQVMVLHLGSQPVWVLDLISPWIDLMPRDLSRSYSHQKKGGSRKQPLKCVLTIEHVTCSQGVGTCLRCDASVSSTATGIKSCQPVGADCFADRN